MNNEKYFAEVERELLSRFHITLEDTGYEKLDWIERFDCEDAKQDVAMFGMKYDLTEMENLITPIKVQLKKWKPQNQLIGKMPRELMEEWQ